MRSLFLAVVLVALSATAAQSQQLARVTISAEVVTPEMLYLQRGRVSEGVEGNGARTRTVPLYVTADHKWVLALWRECEATCVKLQARTADGVLVDVSRGATMIARGEPGRMIPVTVELLWDTNFPAPDGAEISHLITRADQTARLYN